MMLDALLHCTKSLYDFIILANEFEKVSQNFLTNSPENVAHLLKTLNKKLSATLSQCHTCKMKHLTNPLLEKNYKIRKHFGNTAKHSLSAILV